MADDFIEQLHSFIKLPQKLNSEEYNLKANEMFARAHAELVQLKKELTDKDSLLKKLTQEGKQLLNKLNTTAEGEKQAYEMLAGIDLSRHAEVSDLKQDIMRIIREKEASLAALSFLLAQKDNDYKIELWKLSGAVSTKDAIISDLKTQNENLSSERDRLNLRLSEVQSEADLFKNEKTILFEDLFSLKLKVAELQKDLISLTSERDEIRSRLANGASEKTELREKIESAESGIARIVSEKDAELSKRMEELDSVKAEAASVKAKIDAMEKSARANSDALAGISQENSQLIVQLDDAKHKLSDAEKEMLSLKSERDEMKSKLKEIQSKSAGKTAVTQEIVSETKAGTKADEAVPEKQHEQLKAYIYKKSGLSVKTTFMFFTVILIILILIGAFIFFKK